MYKFLNIKFCSFDEEEPGVLEYFADRVIGRGGGDGLGFLEGSDVAVVVAQSPGVGA